MSKQKRKFETTTVNWTRSQAQIVEFLQKEGIAGTRFTNLPTAIMLEFGVFAKEVNKTIPIRMKIPIPVDDPREVNRIYRVFFWYLTNKFEAVRSGLVEEITREFLPFIAFKTRDGVDKTIYEALQEEGNTLLGDTTFPLLGGGE